MFKSKYYIRPAYFYQIAEHEAWFSHMARQGYILDKMTSYFVKFRKDIPIEIDYRIDISLNITPDKEKNEFYKEFGWDYILSAHYYHVYATTNPNHTEFHTDSLIQATAMKKLAKDYLLYIIVHSLLLIVFLAIFLNSRLNFGDAISFSPAIAPTFLLLNILMIYTKAYFSLTKQINLLLQHKTLPRTYHPIKTFFYDNYIFSIIPFVLVLFVVFLLNN